MARIRIDTNFIAGSMVDAPLTQTGTGATEVGAGAAVQVIVTVAVFFTV
jgi:hypothetical protein